MRTTTRSQHKIHKAVCEALEERQLMSLTVEVRNADGTATASVSAVGTVLTLDVMAVISSSNNMPTQDGLEDLTGSFVSAANGSASVAGSLAATNISPFKANGAAPGTQQDLNGDGNLDVGSNDAVNTTGYFFARSSPIQTSATGTTVGNTLEFKIATLTYTVTGLASGGQTSINFVPYASLSPDAAGWAEDANQVDNVSGTFQAGTPFTVSDPALVTPPVAVNDTVTVAENTATDIRELKNDTVIDPLNPASVVATAPAHGTTVLQADGSLLYTPTTGYVGADSFTYTVADNGGRVSNSATVSITVAATPAPIAGAVSATTFLDQALAVNVLSSDSSVGTLVPGSVAVASAPAHGTAVAQSNGTIEYTPANGFLGTDTFTYTVGDSNNETSAPATVTITVSVPTPPVASNDSFSTTVNTPLSLDVLANDSLGSITANPKVYVTTAPTHGTATAQTDGTILYTPITGYTGSDSLQYVVVDSVGDASSPATVSLTITAVLPPTAGDFTAPVLAGQANTINVLADVTGGSGILPAGVVIATPPTNGTATLNSDGTISFTPAAGFLGTDSFTYTVTDTAGDTSAPATVTVDVGTSISSVKGSAHSLSYLDAAHGLETISLNKGVAELFFSGTGSLTVAKNGKATVTGTGLNIGSIELSGTTQASTLSIKGSVKTPTTVAGITSGTLLGSINAPSANLSGIINLPSVGSMTVGTITDATITIGAGAPAKFSLSSGAVTDTTLASAVAITSIKSTSWSGGGSITAPSIKSLTIAGAFDPNLTLSAASVKPVLTSAKITGQLDGTWAITSPVSSISAGSVAGTWVGPSGSIAALTVRSGGFAAALTSAGVLGSVVITGDLTGSLTAASAKSIRVTGNITNATIDMTSAAAGNLGSLTALTLTGSKIFAGVSPTLTIPTATTAGLGTSTIGSIHLTSRAAGAFGDTTVLADKIGSVSIGDVNNDNSGAAFGIAAESLGSFAGVFGAVDLRLSRRQLANQQVLAAYVTQTGALLGDFEIVIAS